LFWSLALSLGGLSLMRAMVLASPSGSVELGDIGAPDVSDSAFTSGSIVVHLEESAEPEDLADPTDTIPGENSGAGGYVSPAEQAPLAPGPGPTSY
jgi:hypothetical protein